MFIDRERETGIAGYVNNAETVALSRLDVDSGPRNLGSTLHQS